MYGGVNANNNIYRASSDGSGNWENIPGKGNGYLLKQKNNLIFLKVKVKQLETRY